MFLRRRSKMDRRQKRADDQHQQIDFHVSSRCGADAFVLGPVMVSERCERLPVQ